VGWVVNWLFQATTPSLLSTRLGPGWCRFGAAQKREEIDADLFFLGVGVVAPILSQQFIQDSSFFPVFRVLYGPKSFCSCRSFFLCAPWADLSSSGRSGLGSGKENAGWVGCVS
jgi:hypothetical protein